MFQSYDTGKIDIGLYVKIVIQTQKK